MAKKNLIEMAESITVDTEPEMSVLYNIGRDWIHNVLGLKLVPDLSRKSTSFHKVLIKSEPRPEKGITYPKNFYFYRPISPDEFDATQTAWKRLTKSDQFYEDAIKFWDPLFTPKSDNTTTPLELYTKQRISFQSSYDEQFGGGVHHLGISFDPKKCLAKKEWPSAFIPDKSWFNNPKLVEEVKIKDILTLFPPMERELLALCLGRAVVGRTGHLPPGYDKPIRHTFRTMPVLFGAQPGQGKSVLCHIILEALKSVGYNIANFKSVSGKFNMDKVVTAHIAYRDDMTSNALKRSLAADDTKQIITGAQINVENKGVDAYNVWANCLLLTNINLWNKNMMYDMDNGILSRVKMLQTYFNVELERINPEGASEGTPSIYPAHHLPYLAKKYDCSQNTLMLWFLRLCADKFSKLISGNENIYDNRLQKQVAYLSNRLRCQFDASVVDCVTVGLMLSYIIRQKDPYKHSIPELSSISLGECLSALCYVSVDKRAFYIRDLIKKDWENKDRPDTHPWKGITRLSPTSIDLSIKRYAEVHAQYKDDTAKVVKTVFESLTLRDGFKIGSGIVYITSSWNNSRMYVKELQELSAKIHSSISDEDLKNLTGSTVANVEHIYNFEFDSEKYAEEMRKRGKND